MVVTQMEKQEVEHNLLGQKKTQVQTHNSKPCGFMMMYCGEIPTSVTVSAKPAEREGVIFVSLSIEF